MTSQETLLSGFQLLEGSPSSTLLNNLHGIYSRLKENYIQEFGLGWTLQEINKARQQIQVTAGRGTGARVVKLFQAAEKYKGPHIVKTKSLSPEEFRLYAKGLYWLAGYLIIKENRHF